MKNIGLNFWRNSRATHTGPTRFVATRLRKRFISPSRISFSTKPAGSRKPRLLSRKSIGKRARSKIARVSYFSRRSQNRRDGNRLGPDGAFYRFRLAADGKVEKVEKIFAAGEPTQSVDGIDYDAKTGKVYITDSARNAVWAVAAVDWSKKPTNANPVLTLRISKTRRFKILLSLG